MRGDNSSLWIIILGNNLWFTVTDSDATRITVSYGSFPSERKKASVLEHQVNWRLFAAAILICPVYPWLIFFPPAIMTFPERALKSSFIEAHSSSLTASSKSPHRYLRSHNDYFTESWLNVLFQWEGMYSSGNGGRQEESIYCANGVSGIQRNEAAFGTSPVFRMKNKHANRKRILPYSAPRLPSVA